MANIKQGHQLHITSWENDGDNYKTKTVDGLTKDEVKYLISIAKLFYPENGRNSNGFGNSDISDKTYEKIWESYKRIPVPEDVSDDWKFNNIDEMMEVFADELIGIWNEGSVFRVYDSFKVYYIPNEITDVTQEFK